MPAKKPALFTGDPATGAKEALAELKRLSSAKVRDGMARYGLPNDKAWGVGVGEIQKLGKRLGKNQALAEALWATDVYEARLLASFVGEADRLTPRLMDRWCRDFDNWGVVDTVCFKLFEQSPHAWDRIEPWTKLKGEFQCRAGYVLLACVAAHNDGIPDEKFLRYLPLIERGATDERNFVKKGVSWALRMVGLQSPGLRKACTALAKRLTESESASAHWIGREALREFAKLRGKM
ncbi:DNA alkylation repair protein [Oleiharenicola lentus]|uniref:DNA alkylation repair protein n=1 Tax=Oleiharenicola lentus TaxID=2508720 RepID=A0A4Q1CBW1_9BACT|nr:DNA alkylation repair protein [Oleiharenicola lentus]RXK56595.1 DNA alkylation repair protein [Oleiharenicola lentus]